jgi:CO/xanthine dehydrogenase Mo-binding subunit
MVVGGLLERCGRQLRRGLGALSPQEYFARHGLLRVTEQFEPPPGLEWDEEHYRGAAYATFSYACDVVEVRVDADTWEVTPLAVTSVHEIGKAIHPQLACGQIEGGTVQGLGMALLERVVMTGGRMANAQLTNYLIPTTMDTPDIDVAILERPYAYGPQGAKGLGELPIDGPAAAVVNAIRHAGFDVRAIPATPELIMEATCASL